MNTKTNTTNTKIRRAIASVALVGMGMATMFTATASAIEMDPIDFEFEAVEIIELPLFPTTSVNLVECYSNDSVIAEDHEGFTFQVEISNNSFSTQDYVVEVWVNDDFDSSYSLLSETVTELGVEPGETMEVFNDPHESVNVKVYYAGVAIPFFDEITRSCDEIAAEEAAAEALAAAEEAAAAAEEAAAEAAAEEAAEAAAAAAAAAEAAAQAAIDQANAERDAAEAALAQAEAEKELALAQVEAEKAKADAILAQVQGHEDHEGHEGHEGHEEAAESTPDSEASDEELAVGEDLEEHSKSGMSGVVLGLIIVLGLVGLAAVTGAVLNLRKQR